MDLSNSDAICFDGFGVGHVPKEIKNIIGNKNIPKNIFGIQSNNAIRCGHFCMGFTHFMVAGKNLIEYSSLFPPYEFKKHDSIILSYFKNV